MQLMTMLAVLVGAIFLGELPPVKHADVVVRQHQSWLLRIAVGMAVVGFLGLVQGWVRLAFTSGRPMSHEEVEALAARTQILSPGKRFSVARLWGKTAGVQADAGPDAVWTFHDMKAAWRSGAWWRDPSWRSKFATTVGGLLTVFGLFGAVFVVSPPSVKFIIAGALVYATARTTSAFWRA